jgi:hypothetical protein
MQEKTLRKVQYTPSTNQLNMEKNIIFEAYDRCSLHNCLLKAYYASEMLLFLFICFNVCVHFIVSKKLLFGQLLEPLSPSPLSWHRDRY